MKPEQLKKLHESLEALNDSLQKSAKALESMIEVLIAETSPSKALMEIPCKDGAKTFIVTRYTKLGELFEGCPVDVKAMYLCEVAEFGKAKLLTYPGVSKEMADRLEEIMSKISLTMEK